LKKLGISGRKVTAGGGIKAVHPPAMLFVLGDIWDGHALEFKRTGN
jgi:hypothetical protein